MIYPALSSFRSVSILWEFRNVCQFFAPCDKFMDVISPLMDLMDDMGVVCEAFSRHGVIGAARIRISHPLVARRILPIFLLNSGYIRYIL